MVQSTLIFNPMQWCLPANPHLTINLQFSGGPEPEGYELCMWLQHRFKEVQHIILRPLLWRFEITTLNKFSEIVYAKKCKWHLNLSGLYFCYWNRLILFVDCARSKFIYHIYNICFSTSNFIGQWTPSTSCVYLNSLKWGKDYTKPLPSLLYHLPWLERTIKITSIIIILNLVFHPNLFIFWCILQKYGVKHFIILVVFYGTQHLTNFKIH